MKSILPLFSLILIVASTGCQKMDDSPVVANNNETRTEVTQTPAEAIATSATEVKSGQAILIDVREQSEWDEAHFTNAILIPMSKIDADVAIVAATEGVDKTKKIYTHCKKGARASKVADALKAAGYNVSPLQFSFEELKENGFDVAE